MTSIGLICAIPQESGKIVGQFPGAARFRLAGFPAWNFLAGKNPVTLVESGMGRANAAAATAAMIESARPDMVLSVGFCGALTPGVSVGELVIARRQLSFSSDTLSAEPDPDSAITRSLLHELNAGSCRSGSFITTEVFTNKNEICAHIPDKLDTPVLEMESAAVARACRSARVPVAALRVVSDSFDEDPATAVTRLFNDNFTMNGLRAGVALLRNPGLIPQLLKLAGNAGKAGDSLANALALILEKLG